MLHGFYISSEGAAAQSRRLEILANNLANVDTPGFKRELAVLQARHTEAIEQGDAYPGSRTINDLGGGVYVPETMTDFSSGTLKKTGGPTDLAIDGDGFFTVEKDEQTLLTRAGNFQITSDGRLVTQDGYAVLSQEGDPIVLEDPSAPVRFSKDGMVEQFGVPIAALGLVKPTSMGDLAKAGQNLFLPLAETVPVAQNERNIRPGHLEMSGVKPTLEMMELIEASRAFETNIRMIQGQDQMLGSLVNRVLRQQ